MNDISSIRLINLIRNIARKEINKTDTMIFGTVVNTNPLEIDIGNNIILNEKFLFLGQMCRPHKVKIPHTHQYNGITENATTGISATAPNGSCVIVDTGHTHDIKEQVTEDVHKKGTDFEESVILEIEPVLQKDDKVLMFAFNNYQMYYVAERIEK